jgi:hypothetical protein
MLCLFGLVRIRNALILTNRTISQIFGGDYDSSRSRNPNLLGRRLSHIYMYLLDHVKSKKVEKRKRGISR